MKKQMLALALLLCAVFAFALCTAAAECNHNYVEQVGRVPATCTTKGSIPYTCSKCGAQKTEEIPMLEHDFVESARIPSTCTKAGSVTYKCSMCGTEKTEKLEATGHDWKEISKTAPTCTEAGRTNYRCSRCGEEKTEEVKALGHDFSVFKSTSATCTSRGESTYQCSRCKELTLKSESALGHDYKESGGPTCTESGRITYTCKRCGYVTTGTTQKALGHDLPDTTSAAWRVYKNATCEESGSKRARCARCGEYVYVDIPRTDHSYGDLLLTKVPTASASGKAAYTCEYCGATKTVTISRGTKDLSDYRVPDVTASVDDGLVIAGTKVSFTCPLAEAEIYYALGGGDPTRKSTRVLFDPDKPLTITKTTILKVCAMYGTAMESDILTLLYLVKDGNSEVYLVENASKGGYMTLPPDRKFRPEDKATRYEVIEAMDKLFDSFADPADTVFKDVDKAHKAMVAKFVGAKLLDGYEDGTFRGGANIKRSELAKVLALALGLDTKNVIVSASKRFGDVSAKHWAYGYIYAMTKAGYLKGDNGNFRPEDNITRAELVTVLNRIAGVKEGSGLRIADVDTNHWAYGYICGALYRSR